MLLSFHLIARPPGHPPFLFVEKKGATIAATRRAGHWIQALGLLHSMHADTWRFRVLGHWKFFTGPPDWMLKFRREGLHILHPGKLTAGAQSPGRFGSDDFQLQMGNF